MTKSNTTRFAPPWDDPQWRSDVDGWIQVELGKLGYSITGQPDTIHSRPWSTVLHIPTDHGNLFFKAGGPTQAFEPGLLRLLSERAPQQTLPLLASEPAEGWSLLPDGGATLRQVANGKPDFKAWNEILGRYAELQVTASEWRNELDTCGVPIRGSDYLAGMYTEILNDGDLTLLGEGEDFLTADQYQRLINIAPIVRDMFAELDSFAIPLSIEHGDLHDANIFAKDDHYSIFDWGDASFTHPFFTLLLPVRHMANKLGLGEYEEHPDLVAMKEAYFEPWQKFAAKERLQAWALAHHLAKFVRTINWYRVVKLTIPELGHEYQASVAGWFLEFLNHPSDRF